MMGATYFYGEPILNGYHFHRLTNFKHGVQFDCFGDSNGDWGGDWQRFLIPLMGSLINTYGDDSSRYEFLISEEYCMYRVYFKDEADQVACKLLYPGEWDKEPDWSDDE